MEEETSLGTPRDTMSLTPATLDIDSLEMLPELVSPMVYGQGISLHVCVSD